MGHGRRASGGRGRRPAGGVFAQAPVPQRAVQRCVSAWLRVCEPAEGGCRGATGLHSVLSRSCPEGAKNATGKKRVGFRVTRRRASASDEWASGGGGTPQARWARPTPPRTTWSATFADPRAQTRSSSRCWRTYEARGGRAVGCRVRSASLPDVPVNQCRRIVRPSPLLDGRYTCTRTAAFCV